MCKRKKEKYIKFKTTEFKLTEKVLIIIVKVEHSCARDELLYHLAGSKICPNSSEKAIRTHLMGSVRPGLQVF